VNPNLPLEDGEFFRRKPGDGQKYTYKGEKMSPRVAVQRIAFSNQYPTNIDFPVYSYEKLTSQQTITLTQDFEALLFPNPARDNVSVYMNRDGRYSAKLYSPLGQIIEQEEFSDNITFDISQLDRGLYFIEIQESQGDKKIVKKFSVM